MPTTDGPVLDALSAADCHRLLTSVPIGRLGFTIGALPTIQPVHFAVIDGEVLIPARRGGKVAAATRGAVVAFEVDEYDAVTRTGWSVTVVGASRVLSDAAAELLDGAGPAPWVPGADGCVIAVRIARIAGRRLTRPLPPAGGDAVDGALVVEHSAVT